MFSTELTNIGPIHKPRSYPQTSVLFTNLGPTFTKPRSYVLEPTFGCLSHILISYHDSIINYTALIKVMAWLD